LGGRDITEPGFEEIIRRGMEIAEKGTGREFEIFGVRE
jgi:pyruvate ferredoxin oxidoreductase alpha subunit